MERITLVLLAWRELSEKHSLYRMRQPYESEFVGELRQVCSADPQSIVYMPSNDGRACPIRELMIWQGMIVSVACVQD